MKIQIKAVYLNFLAKNYFWPALIFCLLLSSGLFYLSWSRYAEKHISQKIMSCFTVQQGKRKCGRKSLYKKRIKNRSIEDIFWTRCYCKNLLLKNVHIADSDFRENHFIRAMFNDVSFVETNLFLSFFHGALLKNVVFEKSDLRGAVFNFASLKNTQFKNTDLRETLFIGTQFKNVYYDKKTHLPFTKERAEELGWILEN